MQKNREKRAWMNGEKFDHNAAITVIEKIVNDYRPTTTNFYPLIGKLTEIFRTCMMQKSAELGCGPKAAHSERFKLIMDKYPIDSEEHRHMLACYGLFRLNTDIRSQVKARELTFVNNAQMEQFVKDSNQVTYNIEGRRAELYLRQLTREVSYFILLCYGDNNTMVLPAIREFYEKDEPNFWLPLENGDIPPLHAIDEEMLADNRGNYVLPIVLCLDNSINLNREKKDSLQKFVLEQLLGQIHRGDRDNLLQQAVHVGIVTIGGNVKTVLPIDHIMNHERNHDIESVLDGLKPYGKSRIKEGLILSTQMLEDYHNQKKGQEGLKVLKSILILISDGSFPIDNELQKLGDDLKTKPQSLMDVWAVALTDGEGHQHLSELVPTNQVMKQSDNSDSLLMEFQKMLLSTVVLGTAVGNFHVSGGEAMQ